MKARLLRKEIRNNLKAALMTEIEKIEGPGFSKRTKKVVKRASRGIAAGVIRDIKKKKRKTWDAKKDHGKKDTKWRQVHNDKESKVSYTEASEQNGHA